MPIFLVIPKGHEFAEKKHRLVKAKNLQGVREHLLSEFEIRRPESEESHDLGVMGVKIETAAE